MDLRLDRVDHEVTEAARRRLSSSPYATIRSVSCEYDGGMLRLRGRVPTFYHKQLAQEAVAGLRGVLQVVNQTEVTAPVSSSRPASARSAASQRPSACRASS